MGLGSRQAARTAPLHDNVAVRKIGMDTSLYNSFHIGQRVMTIDNTAGQVVAVWDGPVPGYEQYDVRLDGGMGQGSYTAGQLTAVGGPVTSAEHHLASDDYPEMGSILYDRPPIEREGMAHTAAKPRPSKKFPYGKRNGIEITDRPFENESGIVECDNCGKYHSAAYDHEGRFGEGPIHAVVCPEDGLTDYYTNARLEPREAVADRSNEDEPQDPTSMLDPFAWADDDPRLQGPDASRGLPAGEGPPPPGAPVQNPPWVDAHWRA